MSESDRIFGRIPPGVYRQATAFIFPPRSAPPDLSPDLSLGPFLDLPAGLSLDPVRFQMLAEWDVEHSAFVAGCFVARCGHCEE